jgi:hypothetical protein
MAVLATPLVLLELLKLVLTRILVLDSRLTTKWLPFQDAVPETVT